MVKMALEQKVGWGISQDIPEVLEVDEYTKRFTSRYHSEESFRAIVHNYLKITLFDDLKLSVGRWLLPGWYKEKTDDMITKYAVQTREGLIKAREVQEDLIRLEKAKSKAEATANDLNEIDTEYQEVNKDFYQAQRAEEEAEQQVNYDFDQKIDGIQVRTQLESLEIQSQTDAKEIVKEKIQEHIRNSDYIQVDSNGELKFDEKMIVRKLEDLFLDEIIDGIEKNDGTGFMSKVKCDYNSIFEYWAEIDDLSELQNVDWVQSMILSRTKGYRAPVFPYFMTQKGEGRGKASLDTAMSLDVSTSMGENDKFEIAKKTTLATHALMRRLNPKNNTYLSIYGSDLEEISTSDLIKMQSPRGWTRTDLALRWLLGKLENKGPSLAYLISDGWPAGTDNIMEDTFEAAAEFKKHPYVMLRIFLIDGDDETRDVVRKIGRAAGPDTKVIPVDNYQLADGVIRDVGSAIRGMYSIANF